MSTASPVRTAAGPVAAPPGRHRRRAWAAAAAALVAAVAVLAATHSNRSGAPSTPTPRAASAGLPTLGHSMAVETNNQLLNDIGDPYVLPVAAGTDGLTRPGYAVFWTTDWMSNIPTAVSEDLVHWRRVADALPTLPAWAHVVSPPDSWQEPAGVSTMTWGPTVHRTGGGWDLYYSTEDAASRLECIGVATSTSPVGPYVDRSTHPLVCQTGIGGDIDPSVVATAAGAETLVWKNDGNATGAAVGIWSQPLSADGLSVTGSSTRLIGADQAWEHGIVEGPAMLADTHGGWWLFYSGGTWQSDTYDTGVAWCATPAGPCRQPAPGPLLSSVPTAVSPGGLDTFTDHRGRLWASYSAFPSRPGDAQAAMESPRVLELAPVLSH